MTETNITDDGPPFLSPMARQILCARTDAFQKLVVTEPTSESARKLLSGVKPEQLITGKLQKTQDGIAMLGGLWLWHDALHECHELVQDLIGPTGSFWHAIMHRREGDFSNAKYWYARCPDHRALRLVSAMAGDVLGRHITDPSLLQIVAGEYNPEAFVDLVAEIHRQPDDPRHEMAARLQQLEWEALFNHCAYEAAGADGGMI